jgi:FKBP-type peptidyl-prolyl cis-trans isomerase 2
MMMNLRPIVLVILAFTLNTICLGQTVSSLLIAEYDENSSETHIQHLVKYSFKDAELISRESIVSVKIEDEKTKKNYVRFDIGQNIIYRNRYIVTGIGNIIDIKNKKVLHDMQEPFAGFMGDSIVFYTNDIFKGKYYSIYNLKTGKYFKVDDSKFNPFPAADLEFDVFTNPFTISRYDVSGHKSVLVSDAGYGELNPKDPTKAKQIPPIYWLDKNKTAFIYANFTKAHHSLALLKVGLDKSIDKIGTIDSVPASAANSFFKADIDGNIIYSCGKGRFVVDYRSKKIEKLVHENVGNGFTIELNENQAYGRKINYKGNEIAKKWCKYDNAKTTLNYLAIESEMYAGGERFPQGVAVWNNTASKWKSIKPFELASIVGWISE